MNAPTLTPSHRTDLLRIQVRPILPIEGTRWNTLMQAHPYRDFRTQHYVITLVDRWVALLGWQVAAYQC